MNELKQEKQEQKKQSDVLSMVQSLKEENEILRDQLAQEMRKQEECEEMMCAYEASMNGV
jgi:hypothetical protein